MRSGTDKQKLLAFIEHVGRSARGPGSVFLVGGSTALLLGIRDQTIDIDIKLDPEPLGVFDSIAEVKERLGINVELASPDHFVPALPGWRERSEFISRVGDVDFFHYDYYGQALAKVVRGHSNDLSDVHALVQLGKVDLERLKELVRLVLPDFIRYPALDVAEVGRRLEAFVSGEQEA